MSALPTDELERRLAVACSVAREAGAFARNAFLNRDALQIETKGEQDWVTNVDLEVEALIRSRLAEDYPLDPVIGEEMAGSAGDDGRAWVVDPIDGTTCFLLGLPQYPGPPGLTPLQPFGLIEMIRDEAGLLIGKAQIVEQGRQIMRMIRDTESHLDEVLNHRRIPAPRGVPRGLRTGFEQLS